MTWMIAVVGGIAGGVFVLLGTWFSDVRARRNALAEQINHLAAVISSCVRMIQDCILEAQVKKATLDTARFNTYELEWVRAEAELHWLTYGSSLDARVQQVDRAITNLVQHWGSGNSSWTMLDKAAQDAYEQLGAEVVRFNPLTARGRRAYLRPARRLKAMPRS